MGDGASARGGRCDHGEAAVVRSEDESIHAQAQRRPDRQGRYGSDLLGVCEAKWAVGYTLEAITATPSKLGVELTYLLSSASGARSALRARPVGQPASAHGGAALASGRLARTPHQGPVRRHARRTPSGRSARAAQPLAEGLLSAGVRCDAAQRVDARDCEHHAAHQSARPRDPRNTGRPDSRRHHRARPFSLLRRR